MREDLERFFARLVRDGDALFVHRAEEPDDMPAHVRRALTGLVAVGKAATPGDSTGFRQPAATG